MTVLADESDAEVMGRARQHPEAFATLFDRHNRKIYAYAARRLGAGLADDIAAETFLIAFDRREDYDRTRADAAPWLYGIAANLIARHARAEARHMRAMARTGAVDVVEWDADAVAGRPDQLARRSTTRRPSAEPGRTTAPPPYSIFTVAPRTAEPVFLIVSPTLAVDRSPVVASQLATSTAKFVRRWSGSQVGTDWAGPGRGCSPG